MLFNVVFVSLPMYSLISCFEIILTLVLRIKNTVQHFKSRGIHRYLLEVNFLHLKIVVNNFFSSVNCGWRYDHGCRRLST